MSTTLMDMHHALPDAGATLVQQANDTIVLAQEERSQIHFDGTAKGFVPLKITLDDTTKHYMRILAAIFAVAWVFYAIWKNIQPGSQGGGFFQKIGGAVPFFVAITLIAVLSYPDAAIIFINFIYRVGWTIMSMFSTGIGTN